MSWDDAFKVIAESPVGSRLNTHDVMSLAELLHKEVNEGIEIGRLEERVIGSNT